MTDEKPLLERLEPADRIRVDNMVKSFYDLIRSDNKLICPIGTNSHAEITVKGRRLEKKTILHIARYLRTVADNFEDEPEPNFEGMLK